MSGGGSFLGALALTGALGQGLVAASPVLPNEAGAEIRDIVEQERYLFCARDNDYQPTWEGDLRWCEIAESEGHRRCPGYAQVCTREIARPELELDWSGEGGEKGRPDGADGEDELGHGEDDQSQASAEEGGDDPGQAGAEDDEQPGPTAKKRPRRVNPGAYREQEQEERELPDLGVFAKVLMWLLLLGAVVGVVVAIAKNLIRDEAEDGDEPPDLAPEPGDSLMAARAAAMRVVETDVQRLLAQAEAAAAKGDHEAAINHAYAALLRRLEGERLINVDPWKTNGDYLLELRRKPALRDELRAVVREVEQVQFGAAAAEASRYQRIRTAVLAIVSRGALALLLGLGLSAPLACDTDERPDSSALAGLGNGPGGKRAVGELLLAHDIEALHRGRTIEELAGTDGAIVLLDDVALDDEDWDVLLEWVETEGGTLVIATGEALPSQLGIDYVDDEHERPQLISATNSYYFGNLRVLAPVGRAIEARRSARVYTEELLVRPAAELDAYPADPGGWVGDSYIPERSYALIRRLGDEDGRVIVFAEPDLFTNAGVTVADNAALLVNLFHSYDIDEVEFVDATTGAGAQNPFASVGNAKLGGLFLQILLFLALLYAAVGIPFARLREPTRRRRRSFAEHVRTLGQRYAQARAARHVASLYSGWALDRLRERLQPGVARGLHPLAQAIAARTGRDEGWIMQILVEAHELREHDIGGRGGAHDLELMRQLATLLDETGGTR